jgi:hypothetical protein
MRTGLAVLVLAAALWLGWRTLLTGGPPLYTAFQATGAAPSGYAVNDWVEWPALTPQPALAAAAAALAADMGIAGPLRPTHGPGWVKWGRERQVGSVETQVLAERLLSGTAYLVVNRAVDAGFVDFPPAIQATRARLTPYGLVHQNITLMGSLPGRLTQGDERALLARTLRAVGAREVWSTLDGNLVSLSAYAPALGSGLSYRGRAVNLEVALSYDPQDDATEVLVGSPVITVTY